MSTVSPTDPPGAAGAGLTEQVLASLAGAPDPRVRLLLESLVRHAHAFVREVGLTEPEWQAGIDFLTHCGQITDDRRQEVVLLSDVLGLSMLTIAVNEPTGTAATEATVFGPFFLEGSPEVGIGGDVAAGVAGRPCWFEGTIRELGGQPVVGARVDVWEADEAGLYDVQYGDDRVAARGHLFTDDEGRYAFWGVTPTPYPIPHDGPVGDLLEAAGRGPMRPAHVHLMVTATGFRRLVTHVFVRGDPHQDSDAVFGVKQSLVVDFVEHPAGTRAPDGRDPDLGWASARFDVALHPVAT
ncbi:MAG: dioxygenase [Nocardioidaceae bacterium]